MIQRISIFIAPALLMLLSIMASPLSAQVAVPGFTFYTTEGETFTPQQLDLTRPVFVMMYDPYCDHCQTQATHIAESAQAFKEKGVQFVWVTLEPEAQAIKDFEEKYFGGTGLEGNLYFLQDNDVTFEEFFGYTDDSVNIYCYSPEGRRPKYFGKEQEAATLLKYL